MAKIPKNTEKFPIQWDGKVVGGEPEGDNIPSSLDITWGAGKAITPYVTCHGYAVNGQANCTDDVDSYYFEDFDYEANNNINVSDYIAGVSAGAPTDYLNRMLNIIIGTKDIPAYGPTGTTDATKTEFTWGDVNFIQEIIDGIGTGSRRARQDRLNKLDDDKKKKLIHLICRVRGEKVYDDYTEVGSVEVKVDDVELVAETIIGKVKLEIKSGV